MTDTNSTTPKLPEVTTFPPGDCQAGLPASESFHDVTFAELKRLNRMIDDLPYPIVLPQVVPLFLPVQLAAALKLSPRASNALKKLGGSPLEATGGVPVGRFMDDSLADLKAPVAMDVPIKDLARFLDKQEINVPGLKNAAAKVSLSDHAMADLLQGKPALVAAQAGDKAFILQLQAPGAECMVPMRNEYQVGPADSFIRNPFVEATDGSQVRVRMSGAQLQALSATGSAKGTVGGHEVLLRAGCVDGAPVVARAFATATTRNEGLESTETAPLLESSTTAMEPPEVPQGLLQLALYLPWRNRWILKGYSRGELIHSLALGPQEEVTLEISTWDRRKRTFEDSANSEFEQTTDFTETNKDVDTTAREMSNQTELGVSIGGDVGFKVGEFHVNSTNSDSIKEDLANSSKGNLEILRESITKTTNKLKLLRETKIGETSELGTENKVTRKVRNPNLCHTLTLNYYEVLAHYDIVTEFNKEDARICVLDRNPIQVTDFDDTNVRYYESVLKRVLLVPDLAAGFEAAKKLFAQSQLCEARRRNEMCSAVSKLPSSDDATRKQLADQAKRAADAYSTLAKAPLSASYRPSLYQFLLPVFWPILTISITNLQDVRRWLYLASVKLVAPHLLEVLSAIHAATPISDNNVQDLAEAINAITLTSLRPADIAKDVNSMYGILRAGLRVPSPPVVFTDIPGDVYSPDDAGLYTMLNTFSETVRAAAKAQQTAAAKAAMEANQASVQTDYSNKELAEALEATEALRTHLNAYKNYYRTCILTLMPFPDEFMSRLSALPIIEGRVVGFDRNEVALPINASLDPRTDLLLKTLVLENEALVSTKLTQKITLPTSGIHVESRLGDCTACEDYITQIRRRDLQTKDAEIDLKKESIAQQKIETARLQARFDKGDLTDPVTHPPVLKVELDQPAVAPNPNTTPSPAPNP